MVWCWESNLGLLEEQLFMAEPSFQAPEVKLFAYVIIFLGPQTHFYQVSGFLPSDVFACVSKLASGLRVVQLSLPLLLHTP